MPDWLPKGLLSVPGSLQGELVRSLQGQLSDRTNRRHSGLRSPTVTTNSQSIGVVDQRQRDR